MAYTIAIEGGDGTGKSTLASYVSELCQKAGLTCQTIGRDSSNSSLTVGKITTFLKTNGDEKSEQSLSPLADIYIRLAREYQRVSIIESSSADVVLLDRFTVSILSRAMMNQVVTNQVENSLIDIAKKSELKATIFCDCPFDIAWARVTERAENGVQALSPKEMKGEIYNRELFRLLKEGFEQGIVTGQRWSINTSLSIEQSKEQLASYLLPVIESLKA